MRIMHICRASEMLVKFMIPVMKEQIRQGHYVYVCVSAHQDSCTVESDALSNIQLKNSGIEVFTHDLERSLNPITMLKVICQIKKILKQYEIDAVICHSLLGSIIGRMSAWLAGVKNRIYFCHGLACAPGQTKPTWLVLYAIERFMAIFTTGMLVMNRYDYMLSRSKDFVSKDQLFMTSGMGVDINEYGTLSSTKLKGEICKELDIPLDKKIVICVARLIVQKGVEYFISAAIDICASREDVHFLLVGDGPLKSGLKHSIANAGLEERIQLIGWRDDVVKLLHSAEIFVLPSYYPEGRSIAVLEAMATGKAVITTNNRGCGDSVENNETGLVVPMHNLVELKKSITCLLDDEKLCKVLGKNARSYVKDNCNLSYCTQLIVNCLDKSMKTLAND